MHHWRKGDKENPAFVTKYPYVVSNEAVIKYMVETNLTDDGLKNRILVMDSAFTTVNVFRMLIRLGCDGVGSVKFPFAGVPQSLLWNKKDVKKKSGPRVQPGDCLHLRSLTDDRALGVQQVMVGPPPPLPGAPHFHPVHLFQCCMLRRSDAGGRECRVTWWTGQHGLHFPDNRPHRVQWALRYTAGNAS
jgi:hypothetical protein